MKLHRGVYLPDDEQHLLKMMSPGTKRYAELPDGRASYQRHKYLKAVEFVTDPKVFVDIGGHVGLWSMQAELDFAEIIAFEPHPVHAELYEKNCRAENVLHKCALGEDFGHVSLTGQEGSSGDTHVAGDGDIPMFPLDYFEIDRIDLLKIDTEGYELPIILGGEDTIRRCKPVVVVEQKGRDSMYFGNKPQGALAALKRMGMRELCKPISGDYFLGFA